MEFLLLMTIHHVVCENFYITTSSDAPCPEEFRLVLPDRNSCLTLQEYASTVSNDSLPPVSDSVMMLELEPGIHTLESALSVSNVAKFAILAANSTATISCNSLTGVHVMITFVENVYVGDIEFAGCSGNRFELVETLILEGPSFNMGSLNLLNVTNVTMSRVSFSTTHRQQRSSGGAALYSLGTSLLIQDSSFTGDSIHSVNSSLVVSRCSFRDAKAIFAENGAKMELTNSNFVATSRYSLFSAVSVRNYGSFKIFNSTFVGSRFLGNKEDQASGVVHVAGRDVVSWIQQSRFADNGVQNPAVYVEGSGMTVWINGSEFGGNLGGAVKIGDTGTSSCIDCSLTITQSVFTSNTGTQGGALNASMSMQSLGGGGVSIIGSTFVTNSAGVGGAVSVIMTGSRTDVSVVQSRFMNNTCGSGGGLGGAMYINTTGSALIFDNEFIDNIVAGRGGAVAVDAQSVSINQTTFVHNTAYRGGGVYAHGHLVLIGETEFFNNSAQGDGMLTGGGAMVVALGTNLTKIDRSTFTGNSGPRCGCIDIQTKIVSQDVIITESVFIDNSASAEGARGGGVICTNGGSVSGINSTFRRNSAINGSGGIFNVERSDFFPTCTSVTIWGSTFENNTAGQDGGVVSNCYCLYVSESFFVDNSAENQGGVFNALNSQLIIVNNTVFISNQAENGGVIFSRYYSIVHIRNVSLENNTADFGEVIQACASYVFLSDELRSSLYVHTAISLPYCLLYDHTNSSAAVTGVPYVPWEFLQVRSSSCFSERCLTLQKLADNGEPRANTNLTLELEPGHHHLSSEFSAISKNYFEIVGNNATINCRQRCLSSLYIRAYVVNVTNVTFVECRVITVPIQLCVVLDAIFLRSSFSTNSNMLIISRSSFRQGYTCYFNDESCRISAKKALIQNSTCLDHDRRVCIRTIYYPTDLTIEHSNFTNNSNALAYYGRGGVVSAEWGTLNITGCIFSDNRAAYGGAVYVFSAHLQAWISRSTFTNNNSPYSVYIRSNNSYVGGGGAVYVETGSSMQISESNFIGNHAENEGGAVYCNSVPLSIEGSVFSRNSAGKSGGAVRALPTALSVRRSQFTSNVAVINGGAVALSLNLSAVVNIDLSTFTYNRLSTTGGNGGALYILAEPNNSIVIYGSEFLGNTQVGLILAVYTNGTNNVAFIAGTEPPITTALTTSMKAVTMATTEPATTATMEPATTATTEPATTESITTVAEASTTEVALTTATEEEITTHISPAEVTTITTGVKNSTPPFPMSSPTAISPFNISDDYNGSNKLVIILPTVLLGALVLAVLVTIASLASLYYCRSRNRQRTRASYVTMVNQEEGL
jgi:predicted outer membrane repeat protein